LIGPFTGTNDMLGHMTVRKTAVQNPSDEW